ncbi:hypothetical protein EJD96_21960 [Herbaspirillum seropedicae]|uniref:DUF6471 domain-containing protein n=1 Tax=Herbaspirillum seropedicae TaxID=964 RepID=UPI00111FCE5A|nr:DUF6471 domain-containing protein [Herbaspirillum seropedicae]QDD66639.1 hypothetical protein EJD96_21960 [Herbaspirillum seropedicae]
MSESHSPWIGLTARIVRVVLARQDVSYAKLVSGLAELGYVDDEKPLAARVSMGRIRLSLLLQIMKVANCPVPLLWREALSAEDVSVTEQEQWEFRASRVIAAEMSQCPLATVDEVTHKLVALGAGHTEKTLANQIHSGEMFLPVFLRFAVILRSPSLALFVDYSELLDVAAMEMRANEVDGS